MSFYPGLGSPDWLRLGSEHVIGVKTEALAVLGDALDARVQYESQFETAELRSCHGDWGTSRSGLILHFSLAHNNNDNNLNETH